MWMEFQEFLPSHIQVNIMKLLYKKKKQPVAPFGPSASSSEGRVSILLLSKPPPQHNSPWAMQCLSISQLWHATNVSFRPLQNEIAFNVLSSN